MRLVITGARDGRSDDVPLWLARWQKKHGVPDLTIVGDAMGVDLQAAFWCRKHQWDHLVCYARWDALGKRAGMERNQRMVNHAGPGDVCLAFPGPKSIGTHDCVRRAKARGLTVYVL